MPRFTQQMATTIMKACAHDRMDATATDMKSVSSSLHPGDRWKPRRGREVFPIVVRSLDIGTGCVKTSLLANPTRSESATGENSFQLLEDELKSCTPTCNCFDLFVVRRPQNVTDRSEFVTDKVSSVDRRCGVLRESQ